MNKAEKAYKTLKPRFKGENWWPVTKEGEIIPAPPSKALTEKQRFEIAIGAILTQNTSWKNVQKAVIELNRKNLMEAEKIARLEQDRLAQAIKASGYYNQKAKKLKIFCRHLVKNYGGSINLLFRKSEGEIREELLGLHGIGKETADAIILYAAEKPAFVIDAYARRIFSRIGICNENIGYDELQKIITGQIKKDAAIYSQYHAMLVMLGQQLCKKIPKCPECPLRKMCELGKKSL